MRGRWSLHGCLLAFAVAACARSGVLLDDAGGESSSGARGGTGSHEDDGTSGGTISGGQPAGGRIGSGGTAAGGAAPTGGFGGESGGARGGRGGAPRGGTGTGGNVPNCRADVPMVVPMRNDRWIALEARPAGLPETAPTSLYLVQITSTEGYKNVTKMADVASQATAPGWSANGRYFAFTLVRSETSFEVVVLDVSEDGRFARIVVPQRQGTIMWSPRGATYALRPIQDFTRLTVVDLTTGAERSVTVPMGLDHQAWSPDGEHVLLWGSSGVVIVPTSPSSLVANRVFENGARHASFSPDGRYLAAFSGTSLSVYDTVELSIRYATASQDAWNILWFRDDWLGWSVGLDAFFLDVTQYPLAPIVFGQHEEPRSVSPGSKCLTYRGYCEAARELGICLQTLPPDPAEPSILIAREAPDTYAAWAGSGDHLLLVPADPRIIHIPLDGGVFSPRTITDGIPIDSIWPDVRWNPSGTSNWIHYEATASPSSLFEGHLWHRETLETFTIPTDGELTRAASWSPDGKYLVFESPGHAFNLHEVLPNGLGRSWQLFDLSPPVEGGIEDWQWQP